MSWLVRHRCRMFFRSSLCTAPLISMLVALAAAPVIRMVDTKTRWTLLGYGPDAARAVVGTLVPSILTFLVFAFSILLLAVQMAGGQLSPRIIARVFESRRVKLVLSTFVFTYTYGLAALGRIDDRVPQLPPLVAILSSLLSGALFLSLIQSVSQGFRPVIILTRVASDTRAAISALYANSLSFGEETQPDTGLNLRTPAKTLVHAGRPGVVLAFDKAGLLEMASRAGCVIELVAQVGDFLATGQQVLRLHGSHAGSLDEVALLRCVGLGPERILFGDPSFGFRIIVDIAIKALSPAINDPTTGVLAIDQLEHLLHLLGQKQLDSGVVRDGSGEVRLVYPTPSWQDFVTLAATEIRLCGASSPQITRRLQAMFQNLVGILPAERSAPLHAETALLKRTIDRMFADPEDRILAGVPDLQGFGSRKRALAGNVNSPDQKAKEPSRPF